MKTSTWDLTVSLTSDLLLSVKFYVDQFRHYATYTGTSLLLLSPIKMKLPVTNAHILGVKVTAEYFTIFITFTQLAVIFCVESFRSK